MGSSSVFITGCNGLIGSFIAKEFLAKGYHVKALRRSTSSMTLVQDIVDRIEWLDGDINDVYFLHDVLKEVDEVVHAAATISFSPMYQKEMYKTNVEGTANVVNACLFNQVKKLCHISSVAAIGRPKDIEEVSESTHWEESVYNSNYGKSKYLAELEVWRGIEEGLNAVIVNPSVVLGPGNWDSGSTSIFKYVFERNKFYTDGFMNVVDVRDVSKIVYQLMISEITGERFILNKGSVHNKDLFSMIAHEFDVKSPSVSVSPFWAEVAWRLMRLKEILGGGHSLITKETVKNAYQRTFFSNAKLIKKLNYHYFDLKDTIHWTCKNLSTVHK